MFVVNIWASSSNTSTVTLPNEGLVIDRREFGEGIPDNDDRFECIIDGTNLTIRKIDRSEYPTVGWNMPLRFRVYDPSSEEVPEFNDECYTYLGVEGEEAPKTVRKVIVRNDVRVIRWQAFEYCAEMRECILHDNIMGIEGKAFRQCMKLKNVRLPSKVQYIHEEAFEFVPIRSLYVPRQVNFIGREAFVGTNLKILVLPTDIEVNNIGNCIIQRCEGLEGGDYLDYDDETHHTINTRLKHMYDDLPLFRICANPAVTVEEINDFRDANGQVPFSVTDNRHNLTPLHILSGFNAYCDTTHVMACFKAYQPAVVLEDTQNLTPLDYMRREGKIDTLVEVVKTLVLGWLLN